ncbi:MAG: hypothetical protein JRI71_10685 [Deltaproteobacteria bacterium]|nr:hypothetical protein [Deltaproteobacteria bacterium]MBW2077993.1 hypothetical protein [Deltaproteobacteria bacterium]
MPAPYVPKKVEDIIYYYYAKLVIAPSAGFERNYGFIIDTYKRLKSGDIQMSDYDREIVRIAEKTDECAFCGKKSSDCHPVHVVPRSLGIPPGMHNLVMACEGCANSKKEKDLMHWWCEELKQPRDEVPRVPLGLYLKIAYEMNKINFCLKKKCNSLGEVFSRIS